MAPGNQIVFQNDIAAQIAPDLQPIALANAGPAELSCVKNKGLNSST